MTIINDRLDLLDGITLTTGNHAAPPDGADTCDACIMEIVAWIAGEPWSDHPGCASPVIGAFLRSWNDVLDDDPRQDLKRYARRLVGSRGTAAQEDARGWMALDWLVRTHTPAWLRLAGLNAQADRLAGLPEFRAGMDVAPLKPTLQAVRQDAAAAWAAAGDAAWAAAWAAAGDAAWAAAGDAARAAARAAARDAARAAARDAARLRLAPTVTELQASAHQLIDRMLTVTEGNPHASQ